VSWGLAGSSLKKNKKIKKKKKKTIEAKTIKKE